MALKRCAYAFLGAQEDFQFEEIAGGRRLVATRRAPAGDVVWRCAACFDESWRISALEIARAALGGEASARYRWDADCWVGEVREGGRAREAALPLAAGLEFWLPSAAFDSVFLERVRLPVDSQRRVETLVVSPETLEASQTHCIVERLTDEDFQGRAAARYRWTDEAGRQEYLWFRDGAVLLRSADPRGESAHVYRLEP